MTKRVIRAGCYLFGGVLLSLFLYSSEIAGVKLQPSEYIGENLAWRCIGPANMGGRIDDVAVVESDPRIIFVATASGGVWKTENNGVTWIPVFDEQLTSSIGDVTVAPSNPDIIWVGTGEPNNRQSSSWGDGVYRSNDAGKTWKNMGLRDTHHIGRIVIHPTNPEIVYVAALGHLWGPNKERGLFKSTDGGKTWVNAMFIDDDTGFVDVAIDPQNPNTLYAAAYQRRRHTYGFSGGGPGSGLYKTTDGGETWQLLSRGLPYGNTGRIGLDVYRSDPNIVYATIEHKNGGIFRSEDKGFSWTRMSETNPRPVYYSKIRIDPNNDQRVWVLGVDMLVSEDGGKTFRTDLIIRDDRSRRRVHGDHHAMWINPADSDHMIIGSDGGIYFSYDRGKNWDLINTIPLAQVYEISLDMRKPYFVSAGLQDNGTWHGPSAVWYRQGITNDEWLKIGGADGFYSQIDPTDHTTIYVESQNAGITRFNLTTGEFKSLKPLSESPEEVFRFNWNSPFFLSPHDPKTIYLGGNRLFKSHDQGETWEASVDLTKAIDREKLPIMGILPDENTLSKHDGVDYYGTITTISESPLVEGLLYVGTDDGNLGISRDGGKTWKNIIDNVPGIPKNSYVSRVVASSLEKETAYVAFDRHQEDDFRPWIYISKDYGETWKNISSNLPYGGTVSVVREHPKNADLLFAGTERGAFFSLDRGRRWIKFSNGLPIVPVDDIAIHPRDNDLILGTHGRGVWILDDITCLQQLTAEVQDSLAYLFDIRPATILNPLSRRGNYDYKGVLGHKIFIAPNPPQGAIISYWLKDAEQRELRIEVHDASGRIISELKPSEKAGINRIVWDLKYGPQSGFAQETEARHRPFVLPGIYRVTIEAGGLKMAKEVEVLGDPIIDISPEERKAQHDALVSLYKMSAVLSIAIREVNDLERQMIDIRKHLKELPNIEAAIIERMGGLAARINKVKTQLLGNPNLGDRGREFSIRGRLAILVNDISTYTKAPSSAEEHRLRETSKILKEAIEIFNKILEVEIPAHNSLLNEALIPYLAPGSVILIDF
ncbi:MAG: hypothetical protein IMZ61_04575 [Planctomycetes bacterium]|nr:hypothetical protein [Planctomycetota bacterium]